MDILILSEDLLLSDLILRYLNTMSNEKTPPPPKTLDEKFDSLFTLISKGQMENKTLLCALEASLTQKINDTKHELNEKIDIIEKKINAQDEINSQLIRKIERLEERGGHPKLNANKNNQPSVKQ